MAASLSKNAADYKLLYDNAKKDLMECAKHSINGF